VTTTNIVGHVTAPGRHALTYVIDESGSYRIAVGTHCWTRFALPFVAPPLIDYPLPAERVSILTRSRNFIVLRGVSAPDSYTELGYVSTRTLFIYREAEITRSLAEPMRTAGLVMERSYKVRQGDAVSQWLDGLVTTRRGRAALADDTVGQILGRV
jgi:hypothetical protein